MTDKEIIKTINKVLRKANNMSENNELRKNKNQLIKLFKKINIDYYPNLHDEIDVDYMIMKFKKTLNEIEKTNERIINIKNKEPKTNLNINFKKLNNLNNREYKDLDDVVNEFEYQANVLNKLAKHLRNSNVEKFNNEWKNNYSTKIIIKIIEQLTNN